MMARLARLWRRAFPPKHRCSWTEQTWAILTGIGLRYVEERCAECGATRSHYDWD